MVWYSFFIATQVLILVIYWMNYSSYLRRGILIVDTLDFPYKRMRKHFLRSMVIFAWMIFYSAYRLMNTESFDELAFFPMNRLNMSIGMLFLKISLIWVIAMSFQLSKDQNGKPKSKRYFSRVCLTSDIALYLFLIGGLIFSLDFISLFLFFVALLVNARNLLSMTNSNAVS